MYLLLNHLKEGSTSTEEDDPSTVTISASETACCRLLNGWLAACLMGRWVGWMDGWKVGGFNFGCSPRLVGSSKPPKPVPDLCHHSGADRNGESICECAVAMDCSHRTNSDAEYV